MDNKLKKRFAKPDKMNRKPKRRNNEDDTSEGKKIKFSPKNPYKISKADLYKPPTADELSQLRETEILFNSNLFRLQTEELLNEININQKVKSKVTEWIHNFNQFLNNIEESEEIQLSSLNVVLGHTSNDKLKGMLKHVVKNNPIQLQTDQDASFKFIKPKDVTVAGLYNINAACKPNVNITLNIQMPKACFYEKDYLNARYLVKKSLYTSYIATHIKNAKIIENISYGFLNGNRLMPIIQIQPIDIKKVTFTIMISVEDNAFKLTRFNPDKSNLRSSYFNRLQELACPEVNTDISTPIFNAVVLHDLTMETNESYRQSKLKGMKGVSDGLILLTTWLRQRELNTGFDGFTDELMYSYVTYLVHISRINKHMSSYQVIRNVWTNLANSTWDTSGIIMSDANVNLALFHEKYKLVFIDRTGHYNFAAHLSENIYLQVKLQAAQALMYLDEGKFNSFDALFMKKMPFYLQHDALITLYEEPNLVELYNEVDYEKRMDYLVFKSPLISNHLIDLLKEGLTDRIVCIIPSARPSENWIIGEKYPKEKIEFTFGVTFNQANVSRAVDKGPQAYEPLAKKFRDFWGYKADLRRFKDGTICEAVHWPTKNSLDKREIFREIVTYILRAKLTLNNVNIIFDQLDFVFKSYNGTGIDEANLNIVNIFDDLSKKIRTLTLPLNITTVQGLSDAFSYTEAFPAIPQNFRADKKNTFEMNDNIYVKENTVLSASPNYVAPVEGVILMGLHSKWPNDIEAINHLIIAFYLQMKEQLYNNFKIKSNINPAYLEVLYNGFVFRFTIFHPKQISLLKKEFNERGVLRYKDTELSLSLEQKFVTLPKLIGALNGLHSLYPSFGPSTILIKRWLNCQLIDEHHFPNIVISLLNAALYIHSAPYKQAVMPQIAFLRFLKMLSTFDFNTQPVIVNFNEEMTSDHLNEIDSKFQQDRASLPYLYIATHYDDLKSIFTQVAPSKEIVNRISTLARECVICIEQNIYSHTLIDVSSFFKTNMSGYNLIIHLKPALNPRRHQDLFLTEDERPVMPEYMERNDKIPVVDFNPIALYLKDLRDHYSDFAIFFHDSYGGNDIAVLWKPSIFLDEEFKVLNSEGKLLTTNDNLKTNVDAIIEDFYILGADIVTTIEKL